VSQWASVSFCPRDERTGNGVPLFHLLSVSYINPDFRLADYSACRLLSRWFLAQHIFSTLKMRAICFSKASVDTKRTTRRYISEDGTLHNHRCENLKSCKIAIINRLCLLPYKRYSKCPPCSWTHNSALCENETRKRLNFLGSVFI
jgi:hypothetical protein